KDLKIRNSTHIEILRSAQDDGGSGYRALPKEERPRPHAERVRHFLVLALEPVVDGHREAGFFPPQNFGGKWCVRRAREHLLSIAAAAGENHRRDFAKEKRVDQRNADFK